MNLLHCDISTGTNQVVDEIIPKQAHVRHVTPLSTLVLIFSWEIIDPLITC
jgi:hypothetical protein